MKYFFTFLFLSFNFVFFSQNIKISEQHSKNQNDNFDLNKDANQAILYAHEDIKVSSKLIEKYLDQGFEVILKTKKNIEISAPIFYERNQKGILKFISEDTGTIQITNLAKIVSTKSRLDFIVKTQGNIKINPSTQIQTNGGDIQLQAFKQTQKIKRYATSSTVIDGTLDASAIYGGKITIESDDINIGATARVLSTGANGGGKILIGGDWQGGTVQNKRESEAIYESIGVHVAEGALIDASAKYNGNGGKVVVWSNIDHPKSNTEVKGQLLAMGGKYAGKGGMIETSGGAVDFEKVKVSTIASDGSAGEWLLDPWNFYFTSAQLTTLASNLSSNNISVSTGNSNIANANNPNTIFGTGHIVLQSDLTYTGASARTLTLSSHEDIWINGNITSTGGALQLVFNAPSAKRVLIDGDITTNGGSFTINNNATVHFQKSSGTQTISTNGGAISMINSNIKLLRYNGTLVLNSGGGTFETWGVGTVDQIDTRFTISGPTQLFNGFGGAHVNSQKDYGVNIVAGREYSTRVYFWDSWDNERGELVVFENSTNQWRYYFTAHRTNGAGGNEMSNLVSNFGTQYQIYGPSHEGRSGWMDVYVDITFVAQHNGILRTWNNLNQADSDESLEIFNVWETQLSTSSFTTGSRSLELISASGQILCGTKNFSGLANLTLNTNNNSGYIDGVISGTTNVIKSGSGSIRLSGVNSYTGTTTVNNGTLRFFPYGNGYTLTGNVVNNGTITYETGNVNNRGPIFLSGAVSGSGSWTIGSTDAVLPVNIYNNRLVLMGNTTISGQVTILNFGNLWLQEANINTTSPINLNGTNSRLRVYGINNSTIAVGAITGNGVVDFPDGGGGKNLTLAVNTNGSNAQFEGTITNSSSTNGPTVLSFRKDGAGTYTLTGNNTYSGTTLVNGGVLQIGNGGTSGRLGSGALTVGTNDTLNFNLNTATSFNNGFNFSAAGATIANTSSTSSAMITLSGGVNAGTFGSSILDGGTAGITVSGAATPPAPGAGVWIKGDVTFTGSDLNTLVILSVGSGSTMRFKTTATLWFFGSTTAANAPNIVVDPSITISQNTSQGAGNLFYNNLSGSGTISLAGTAASHFIIGQSSVGSLNATTNIALVVGQGGATGSIVSGNITANNGITLNSTSSYVYSGVLAGTTLTKQNTNTVTLTGTNSYSGATTISGGNLQIGNNGTTGSIGSGNVINNGNLVFRRSDNLFFNNIISGTGIVIKESSGRVNLMSANTYSGGTTVSSGTIAIYNATSLGTGNVSLASSTSLLSGRGVATVANNIILNGNANIGLDNEVEVLLVGGGGGASSGGGGGGGVVSQTVTASSGTYSVLVGLGGAGGTPSHVGTNGANGENTTFNGIAAFGGGGGARAMSAGLPGASGGGAGSDCTLSGGTASQGFPGGTGPSALGGTGASGGGGAGGAGVSGFTQVAYNTLYGLSGQNTMGGNGGIGTINSITGTLVYYGGGGGGGCNNNNLLQAVERAGQGGLGGGGRGANGDRINGLNGTANTGGGGGGGDWEATTGGNGGSGIAIIRYRGGSSATGGTITSGTGIAAGYTLHTFTNSGNNSFTLNGSAVNLTGVISGTGNITFQSNDGTISLSGNNTYTGNTIISSGTLILNTSGTIDSGNYSGNISNSGIFRIRSNTEHLFSGIISGTGELIKETSTSILKLTGTNTYSGTTTISSGTIQIGDSTTTGIFGTGNIVNNSAILVKRSNDLTMSNLISGTGTLTKENSNVLTLTQNNTYSGNNTINGGTLVLQNNAPNPTNKTFNGTGKLRIEPASASFTSGYSTLGYTFNSSLSELTLGKVGNLSTITSAIVTSISGPVTIFGGSIAINENISSSNGGTISIFGKGLTFGSGKSVSSSGQLIVAPQTASTTIGIGGATGTLSLPASFFSINFADGFSNIQIGSSTQTGNISVNTFSLKDDISLLTSGSLTLGGKPELGSNHVTLGTGITTINVGSPANYFQTNGSGTVIRSIANNTNLLFPIGRIAYNPISVNNKTGTTDTFSVNVLDTAYLNGSSGGTISSNYVKRTWNISKNTASANAGSGVDFSFTWNADEVVGSLANPTLNHHNGSSWEIPTMGTSSISGTTLTYTGYKGTFSPFAIGGSSIFALPVELKEFKATCQSDYIQIDWTTASEIRNKAFELFKSEDAHDWKLIYTTEGQGTKATETNYQFNDLDKKAGYYRLKDIDEDGVENWSQIIFADCKNDASEVQIYPNPASDYIKIIVPQFENTTLNILSLEGKIIKTMPLISNQTMISIKDLVNGIYMIEINNTNQKIKWIKK